MINRLVGTVFSFLMLIAPSHSEEIDGIPQKVANRIKAKCISDYPDDYVIQSGCIKLQSKSYLEVHGTDTPSTPNFELSGIPSAFDQAQINNSAYLTVAKGACKIEVGDMPLQYRERAVASDRLSANEVDALIEFAKVEQLKTAKAGPKAFCNQARRNLQNFVADLKS